MPKWCTFQLVQQGKSEDAPAYHTGIVYIVWSTAVPCNVVGDVCYFILLHGVSIVEFIEIVGNHVISSHIIDIFIC